MISIRDSLAELERCHGERTKAVECYVAAIENAAQYAVELDPEITAPHRKHLNALAAEVSAGSGDAVEQSRASFRALLRDYRDKAGQFLNRLREELAVTARALQETLSTLARADGDQELRTRDAMRRLREIAELPGGVAIRGDLLSVAGAIETGFEEMRRQHSLAVSQFLVEIQMLHHQIDALQTAASLDHLTKLRNRGDMEERVRLAPPGSCLLMAKVTGIHLAESRYPGDVVSQLVAAFTKRLRNMLPATAVIGRWGDEEFLAILTMRKNDAIGLANRIAEHLSGSYACVQSGKTVRPALRLNVAVLESAGERLLGRVREFLS